MYELHNKISFAIATATKLVSAQVAAEMAFSMKAKPLFWAQASRTTGV